MATSPISAAGISRSRAGSVPVIYVAAAVGALLLAFETYILVKWVSGPDFKRVPGGPSDAPGWMRTGITVCQVLMPAGAIYCFWRFLIRPWRRERAVTLYGLLCPALVLTSVYDPLGSYFSNWYGYNAYFVNFGTPLPGGVPGWQSFAEPGAMIAWPLLFIIPAYVTVFIFNAWFGGKVIRAVQRRHPRTPPLALGACFLTIVGIDILLEGTIMMRLGWYAETGASINEGAYYQLPWRNVIFAALMWTMLAGFCAYRNDKGQTLFERGVERHPASSRKAIGLRFLAVLAATQLILVVFYQAPMGIHQKAFEAHWPTSIQSKSYFNNHICGFDTPRRCP